MLKITCNCNICTIVKIYNQYISIHWKNCFCYLFYLIDSMLILLILLILFGQSVVTVGMLILFGQSVVTVGMLILFGQSVVTVGIVDSFWTVCCDCWYVDSFLTFCWYCHGWEIVIIGMSIICWCSTLDPSINFRQNPSLHKNRLLTQKETCCWEIFDS